MNLKKMFCNHDFEIIKEQVIPSELDVMRENGITKMTVFLGIGRRQYVTFFKCKKCHKINKDITKTLDMYEE